MVRFSCAAFQWSGDLTSSPDHHLQGQLLTRVSRSMDTNFSHHSPTIASSEPRHAQRVALQGVLILLDLDDPDKTPATAWLMEARVASRSAPLLKVDDDDDRFLAASASPDGAGAPLAHDHPAHPWMSAQYLASPNGSMGAVSHR